MPVDASVLPYLAWGGNNPSAPLRRQRLPGGLGRPLAAPTAAASPSVAMAGSSPAPTSTSDYMRILPEPTSTRPWATSTPAAAGYEPYGAQTPTYGQTNALPLEQWPAANWGFPAIEAMMRMAGYEPYKDANGQVRWRSTGGYMADVERQYTGLRDELEPELQRMISQMGGNLEARGLGDSSIAAGGEVGLRSNYLKNLAKQRQGMIEEEEQQQFQRLMMVLSGSGDLNRALKAGEKKDDDGGTDWAAWAQIAATVFA